MEDRDQIKLF